MAATKLDQDALQEALSELSGWEVRDGKLHKQFKFDSFGEALGWMVKVGVEADKMDHHPEWTNVYNKVTVDLTTHSLDNAISNLDAKLAGIMDDAASR